jgi:hypothetical protein
VEITALRKRNITWQQWLMPVIPSTQEGEIRRLTVQSQPGKTVHKTLSQKNLRKNMGGGMAQGGTGFKPQYHKKKKRKERAH